MTKIITFPVLKSDILGIPTYRGTGLLSDIAKISKADIFDEVANPKGTQRDLKINHARSAYNYVKDQPLGFWPEVILCVRDPKALKFDMVDNNLGAGYLHTDLDHIEKVSAGGNIAISRVDGNHRLHFADGKTEKYPPIDKNASFCLLMGLSRDQEIELFRDINNNLERMPTSHLDFISVRLTPEELLKRTDPSLYIAQKLDIDFESPFYNRISKSGNKTPPRDVPLRALKSGVTILRSSSKDLSTIAENDLDIEYSIIKNYFLAVKAWQPKAWDEPKKYLLLRGAGLWATCYLGGAIIDRCLAEGKIEISYMLQQLKSGRDWNWENNGDFKGFSGHGGAKEIADMVKRNLPTKSGISMVALKAKIRAGTEKTAQQKKTPK